VDLSGIFPALTTPYREDGTVALDLFKANLARYNQTGVAGYVVLGSTGESVLLTASESESLLAAALEAAVPGKLRSPEPARNPPLKLFPERNVRLRSATRSPWSKLPITTSLRTSPKSTCDTIAR